MTLLGQRTFDDLGTPLPEVSFCVLDLETTGVGPESAEITEIGAIRYEGGVETGRFQTLVNPGTSIPPQITVMTGITHAMVIDAPTIAEVLPSFLEFLGDAVIVGHNVSFDLSFLNAAAIRLGYGRLPNRHTDTLALARRLVGSELRNLKLSSLAAYFRSPTTPNHRALDDTAATAHIFWCLLERAGSIGVTHLDDLLDLPTIKGSRAIGKLGLTEHLPRKPGIYRFVDASGTLLYIGKATNLRSRVRSYFAGETRRRVDAILRATVAIDHQVTSSELEASIVELREIHERQPIHNRRSKPPRSLHWVRLTKECHPRFQVARTPGRGLLDLGPFRSRRAALEVMHALWDGSRIRRCPSDAQRCSLPELGATTCPCAEEIPDEEYRAIVDQIIHQIEHDPDPIFASIEERMATFVRHRCFEDAAAVRDRRIALTRALEQRRAWNCLQDAGRFVAVDRAGLHVVVNRGRLESCWADTTGTAATPLPLPVHAPTSHPDTMAAVEEVMLLWRWLNREAPGVVEISGNLATPAHAIVDLAPKPSGSGLRH